MKLDTAAKRIRLKPRREPYWHKIAKGKYLGYRRTPGGSGTWTARMRGEDEKQKYHALGSDLGFDEALKAAMHWMGHAGRTEDHRYTLKQAVDDYVRHLEINNSSKASSDTKQRLEKHLPSRLLKTELSRLTTAKLNRWRDSMVKTKGDDDDIRKSKDSVNRVLSMLKAALNLAFRNGLVATDTDWRRVSAFRNVTANRRLFLSDKQVTELLEATSREFHNLIKAGVLTGARYGELAEVKVKNFDSKQGTIELIGKTGHRVCFLSDDAIKFFKAISENRLPEAYLLVKDDGTPWGRAHQQRPMGEAVKQAKLPKDTVFYSLRHYHISKALLSGMPMQVVAENTGTSVKMIETNYGKFTRKDRRDMMNEVVLG